MKYIDNDIQKGIEYDWKKLYKKLDKLAVIPNDIYYPLFNPNNKWNVILSERKIGKTTSCLLLGMLMNVEYGTIIQYVREDTDMIMPKNVLGLFDVILKNGYVEKITDNMWNGITYKSRKWYFCNVDENGKIIEQSTKHFMQNLCLQEASLYKSSYNCPTGDLIIFDEFISNRYVRGDFVVFCDLLSTIVRSRLSATIVMLANTIDVQSEYFDELECRDIVDIMKIGDDISYTTEKGTNIYIAIEKTKNPKMRDELNKLYFGFKNQKLNSITGEDWAFNNYSHIAFEITDDNLISKDIYILHKNKVIQLELVNTDFGLCVACHYANAINVKYAKRIYSIDELENKITHYALGNDKLDKLIWNLYKTKRFYYANNMVGSIIENYYNISRKEMNK